MESNLQVFNSNKLGALEVLMIDGEPYFPAIECAAIAGYSEPHDAVECHCSRSVKRSVRVETGEMVDGSAAFQMVERVFIPRGDLDFLTMCSSHPRAIRLDRWVSNEVLPSIRKRGKKSDTARDTEISLEDNLQTFKYNDKDVRAVQIDGGLWWVLEDVYNFLEIDNSRDVLELVDADEKADVSLTDISSSGTTQCRDVTLISEPGLYSIMKHSKKRRIKNFRNWIIREIWKFDKSKTMAIDNRFAGIMIDENNGLRLEIEQQEENGMIEVRRIDGDVVENTIVISPSDMVTMLNWFRHQKGTGIIE